MSDQVPQCSYTDRRRCMGAPVDENAGVPLCEKHMTRVLADLLDRGFTITPAQVDRVPVSQ